MATEPVNGCTPQSLWSKSSVFSLLRQTSSDGNDRTDSGRLFQVPTDAAAAGNAREVRGATSAGVLEERNPRRALRSETCCSFDARWPDGEPWRQRHTAPPAWTKTVHELEASAGCATETGRGPDDELRSATSNAGARTGPPDNLAFSRWAVWSAGQVGRHVKCCSRSSENYGGPSVFIFC